MSLRDYITSERRCQIRALIVRVIEDAIVLLMLCIGIWLACWVFGGLFRWLGVG